MKLLSNFRRLVLSALSDVPKGYIQRIDGLRCEPILIRHDWWFFGPRLYLMELSGLISSSATSSFWPSCDGMPGYAITDKGRKALKEDELLRNLGRAYKLGAERLFRGHSDKIEAAKSPDEIRKTISTLRWALRQGYRPVPGYTVRSTEENGDLYIAIQLTKEK